MPCLQLLHEGRYISGDYFFGLPLRLIRSLSFHFFGLLAAQSGVLFLTMSAARAATR